jgi:triose/dihydroxyacetone kinase / FAD-AMP lyase (cyclizing)
MTALDMSGISLSVMQLDEDLLQWLDAPTDAPAWPKRMLQPNAHPQLMPLHDDVAAELSGATLQSAASSTSTRAECIRRVCAACAKACIAAEPLLTEYDRKVPGPREVHRHVHVNSELTAVPVNITDVAQQR